jgi:glycosyltransferase involved in cell wall biosynthesis
MLIVHLTASTFFGGPERQMLGLAQALPAGYSTEFISFSEGDRCQAFLAEAKRYCFRAAALAHDTPRLDLAYTELVWRLRDVGAQVLCCHGYKAGLTGLAAARKVAIPVVAVSRGWTGENLKVRLYEQLDRVALRWMDRVVCVSHGQATKVRRTGVPLRKMLVIPNAVNADRFSHPDPAARAELHRYFATPPKWVVAGVGRLSPEKGFDVLIRAAAAVARLDPSVGFVVFGDGPLRKILTDRIITLGLEGRFVLAGYRSDLDRLFPCFDLLALSSYTEGLPNVVLEAFASGVPVVATAVGGTPEILQEGINGFLIRPGDSGQLADRILAILGSNSRGRSMGASGKRLVSSKFSFRAQSDSYRELFEILAAAPVRTRACPQDYLNLFLKKCV